MNDLQLYLVIKIKSFHSHYLNQFSSIIAKKFRAFFPIMQQQVFLPKRVERFTVLRSPHVDKKARDQFERRIHKRVLFWGLPYNSKNKEISIMFFRILKILTSLAIGVEFRITYMFFSSKKNTFLERRGAVKANNF